MDGSHCAIDGVTLLSCRCHELVRSFSQRYVIPDEREQQGGE
jgi:hypothetical protein